MPVPGASGHAAMTAALEALFREHNEHGRVRFWFDTEIYLGQLD
jgi:hypothetical protein